MPNQRRKNFSHIIENTERGRKMKYKIGFIGAGHMAQALISAIENEGVADKGQMYLYDLDNLKRDKLRAEGYNMVKSELAEGLLLCLHDFHHLQAGQNTVAGGGVLGENDVSALLAAQATAMSQHIFIYIFISNSSFCILDTQLIKGFIQAKV